MDKQKPRKNLIILAIICIAVCLCAYLYYLVWIMPYARTEDAYIGANYISVTPQISGIVTSVNVNNNQFVKKGDLLFTIDPGPAQKSNVQNYTKIYAPFDGQISNCTLVSGQYVNAGTPQFALISYAQIWVDANFKETQLADLRHGQNATIKIDMYPNKTFTGTVASISGATGTVFSLLPPQNATGNWVKVTQRVPVRIILNNVTNDFQLHIGISAEVSIKVK